MGTLLGLSLALNLLVLPTGFGIWCLGYLIINLAYSLKLKRLQTLDVICLASLYTLRILAGGAATETPVSYWLMALSTFLFLSLALVKRVSELKKVDEGHDTGRDYVLSDVPVLMALGAASAYSAVLVLSLYIHSDEVSLLHRRPELLWFLTPLLIYWLTRVWILTMRGRIHEDPVIFALKDRVTWAVAILGLACLAVAL
jgi:4-hydroxybenzoate polyprenyltransferase